MLFNIRTAPLIYNAIRGFCGCYSNGVHVMSPLHDVLYRVEFSIHQAREPFKILS